MHKVEKIHQEDITRTHIDRHKISPNSALSSSVNNLSIDIDNLIIDDVRTMEQDIAYGINVVRHKTQMTQILTGNHYSLIVGKNSRSGHSICSYPEKRYIKPLEKHNFQKQTFNQAMKGNQNLPNKQVTSNNMTVKLYHFPIAQKAKVGKLVNLPDIEVLINRLSFLNRKPYYGYSNFKPLSRTASSYARPQNFQKKRDYNKNNTYSSISRPQ